MTGLSATTGRRQRVGYLPEQPYFPKFLSAMEVVHAHAGLSGLSGTRAKERVEGCLRQVGMWDNRHMVLSKCSKGMTQRVGLASALVGDPDLLIMDEPSSGLDPVGPQRTARSADDAEGRRQDDLSVVASAVRDGVGLRPGGRHGARQVGGLRDAGGDHAGAG